MTDNNTSEMNERNGAGENPSPEDAPQAEASPVAADAPQAEASPAAADATQGETAPVAAAPVERPARTDSGPSRERRGGGGRRGHHDGPRDREGGSGEQSARMPRFRRKVCAFCQDKNLPIDYKRSDILGRFITDRGKILPRRVTGTCAKHQRIIAREIKRARIIALLPFVEQ